MKGILHISLVVLIMLSGMQLSIATHYCGGHVAAVKWSFSGQKATCGMENTTESCSFPSALTSKCCQDEISSYSVDNNYNLSASQIQELSRKILQVFEIPEFILSDSNSIFPTIYADVGPPDEIFFSSVSLSDICVLRI